MHRGAGEQKKLRLPQNPFFQGEAGGHEYTTASYWRKLVADYTGLNFLEVSRLNYLQYLIWRRDAWIHMLSRTETGQEYLDKAWLLEQTKADRSKLRKRFGKGGETHGE